MRALLLQALYSIRSERQLVERIELDLLFRWFVGLGIEDPVWDATTFTKNRDRLLDGEVAQQFLAALLAQQGQGIVVERTFLGRRHPVGGLGQPEEFPPEGRLGRPAGGAQRRARLHGERAGTTRTPRPPTPTPGVRKGKGKEARLLYGPCADGEPHGLVVGAVATAPRAIPSGWPRWP